jgi:hypothetical protein
VKKLTEYFSKANNRTQGFEKILQFQLLTMTFNSKNQIAEKFVNKNGSYENKPLIFLHSIQLLKH